MKINTLHKKACDGDRTAESRLFEILTVRFRVFVYQRVWNEDDAKEVVQDALITISEEYRGIEFKTSFSAWAYKVLQNKISNHIRKKTTRDKVVESVPGDRVDIASWVPDPRLEPTLLDCLRKIADTNLRYARILNLRHQGYEVADICRKLQLKPNNFYVILLRARSMLKQCLEKGGVL